MPSVRVCQPAPCVRGARAGWRGAAVWLLVLGGCGPTPTAPSPPGPAVLPEFITYEGEVVEPAGPDGMSWLSFETGVTGIPGVTVTIAGGQPDGWTTVTDAEGRFAFENYPYCALHTPECLGRRFRVEKAGYQTREVGASDPFYWNSITPSGRRRQDAQWKRIVVSREWPADPQIQRMLREVSAMSPLWLAERPALGGGGYYVNGVITVYSFENLLVLAHEYCNAHADWAIDPDRYGLGSEEYSRSPEGRAFLAAWEADLPTNDPLLLNSKDDPMVGPGEKAVAICTHYNYEFVHTAWGRLGRTYIRERLPHLYAWATEWLHRR